MSDVVNIAVLVAAGGSGTRFGGNKLLAQFQGEAVFTKCLRNLNGPGVRFVVATHTPELLSAHVPEGVEVLWAQGGDSRTASVGNALEMLHQAGPLPPFVAVHDAARPLATYALLQQCREKLLAEKADGVVAAHRVTDTIHQADANGCIQTTPLRSQLWAAETPQLFRAQLLWDAYQMWRIGGLPPSDDAALVHDVFPQSRIVLLENPQNNLKITYRHDL